jgi:iron complex outermembrane receptor protein
VPGLEVNQYAPTITIFNIRGVSQNDFTDGQEAPIAFYQDEVYVSALGAISGMNFDLERVEVLRGPQGTLFGRNATGGLVQFFSAKPTRQLSGFLTVTGGSYGQVATEGAISGPLSDKIRARLSITTNNSGGYIKNTLGPSIGNSKFYAGRFQIAADLSPRDTLNLKAQILRNAHERNAGLYSFGAAKANAQGLGVFVGPNDNPYDTCNGCDPFGYSNPSGNPFIQSEDHTPDFDRTFVGLTARWEHNFDFATLTSITDYQHLKKDYSEDTDSSPNAAFVYHTHQQLYQLSEELRLAGKTSKLNWVVGAYGLEIHSSNQYQNDLTLFDVQENYGGTQTTRSIAVFGQGEYALTDQFSAILGLRYSYDRKHLEFQHVEKVGGVVDSTFDFATSFPAAAPLRFESFGNWSGKFELDCKPNTNTLIYASVNRGTKSGGFGVVSFPPFSEAVARAIPFGQEVLTNYEAGAKLTLLNRTTHLNGSIFSYDYKGYQAFNNVGFSQFITNNKAHDRGIEIEANSRPVKGFYISAFVTLLDTKIKNLVLPFGDKADTQLPQAPKTSIGWSARYEFPLGPGDFAVATDWKHDSGQFFETYNAPVDYEPPHLIGNVRVSYKPSGGHWEGAFFINNVTDKWYRVYNLDLSLSPLGDVNQTYARPRTFGGSLTYRY